MAHTVHSSTTAGREAVSATGQNTGGSAVLTGQVGAVQWNGDHTEIRLYCPDNDYAVKEYRWQGGDPWTHYMTLAGSSLTSRAAAVHWLKDNDTHLRVYFEDTNKSIQEKCYDTPDWTDGTAFPGARPGTGIAAVAIFNDKKKTIHLMLFYQVADNRIVAQYWNGDDGGGWNAIQAFQGAAPGTGIAAVYYIDNDHNAHVRLYYQDTSNTIVEQCYDGGEWSAGQTFTARAGTGIAAAHWWESGSNSSHLRLYYQNSENTIVEQCYDTDSSWTTGHSFDGVESGTGVAAVAWHDSKVHLRVYYEDTTKALIEQCYDEGEGWTRGAFVAAAS